MGGGEAGDESAGEAGYAVGEEDDAEGGLGDVGDVFEKGCDVGVGAELAVDDEHADDEAPAGGAGLDDIPQVAGTEGGVCGEAGKDAQLHDDDGGGDEADEGECAAPAEEAGDEDTGGDADDGAHGDAGEDDGQRAGGMMLPHEAGGEAGGHGPESAQGDAKENAAHEENGEGGGERSDEIGCGQKSSEHPEEGAAVGVAGEDHDHGSGDGGGNAGHGDHEARGAIGDAQVTGDGWEEADGKEFTGDVDEGTHGNAENSDPCFGVGGG